MKKRNEPGRLAQPVKANPKGLFGNGVKYRIPVIKQGATDDRNYGKKAVSWARRNIGKRNRRLNQIALDAAQELQAMDAKSARWIACDAVRDLTSDTTKRRLDKQEP